MTQQDLFQTVTSSQPDIPASPSVSPESKEAQRMTAISGRSLAKLLHTKDPLFAFSKMFMVTLPWVSMRCLLTWKPKITPQGRLLCQLAPSMPRTDATDSGLSEANVGNAGCVTKGQSRNGLSEERLNSGTQGQWSVEGHRLANTSENVADTDSSRQQQSHKEMAERSSEQFDSGSFQSRENVADTDNEGSQGRLSGRQGAEWQGEHGHARCSGAAHRQSAKDWWAVEPSMGRVADGLPKGLDRFDGWEREPADIPRVARQRPCSLEGAWERDSA
jgi:hypothetical protein